MNYDSEKELPEWLRSVLQAYRQMNKACEDAPPEFLEAVRVGRDHLENLWRDAAFRTSIEMADAATMIQVKP